VNLVTVALAMHRCGRPEHSGREIMRNIAPNSPYFPASAPASGRVAVWNRRLLLGAVFFILWAASMLALQAVGPEVRSMIAAEGMVVTAPGE
jgi:hypothetical protein